MSVYDAGVNWKTLKQKVMLGGKQISKIYLGNTLIYPEKEQEEQEDDDLFKHVTEAHFTLTYDSQWVDGRYNYGFHSNRDLSCALPSECTCEYDIYIYFSTPVTIILDHYTYKRESMLFGGQYLYTFSFFDTATEFNGDAYYYEIETDDCTGKAQNHAMYITGRRYFSYKNGSDKSPIADYVRTYDYKHASYRLAKGTTLEDFDFEDRVKKEFFKKYNINMGTVKRIVGGGSNLIGSYCNDRIRNCSDNIGTSSVSPSGSNPSTGSSEHPLLNRQSVTDIRTIMNQPYGVNANGVRVDSAADCAYKFGYLFSSGSCVNINETYDYLGPGGTGMGKDHTYVKPMAEITDFVNGQDELIGYHQENIWKNCTITFEKIR